MIDLVFLFILVHNIVCPLMYVNKIDKNSFSKDLINYKNITFKESNEIDEYDIKINDFKYNDIGFNLGGSNINEYSQEESFELSEKEEKKYNKINGLIKAINYLNKYSKMKGEEKKEKYIILFTDMLNMKFNDQEEIELIMDNLKENKEAFFLLVGKTEKIDLKKEKSYENNVTSNSKSGSKWRNNCT